MSGPTARRAPPGSILAMTDPAPSFLVDAHSDPVAIRVQGRASFQNSGSIKDFFAEMLGQGKRRFMMDFAGCTSMDSTFLGVLAGAALQLRKVEPPGSLVLCRLATRNHELVTNLGLHRLLIVDPGCEGRELPLATARALPTSPPPSDEVASARQVLEAHENLILVDAANRPKFQDVLAFLKNRIDEG